MPKKNRHKAYWLDEVDSIVLQACINSMEDGIMFPDPENLYVLVLDLWKGAIYHISEALVNDCLLSIMELMEPKSDEESWDNRRRRFFNKLRNGKYRYIYDKEETKSIPAFATEQTGIDILEELWANPYRDHEEIAMSCNVSQSTVRYHLRRACRLVGIKGKYPQFQLRDRFFEDEFIFFLRESGGSRIG